MKWFEYRIYIIRFNKHGRCIDWGVVTEITDSSLIDVLSYLQEKYDFKIIKTKFRKYYDTSYIIIKCKKDDRYKIFAEFCSILNGKIDSVSF